MKKSLVMMVSILLGALAVMQIALTSVFSKQQKLIPAPEREKQNGK